MPKSSAQPEVAMEAPPARRDLRRVALPALLVLLALINILVFALALKPAGIRTREQRDTLQRLQDEGQSRRATVARLREIISRLDVARNENAAFYQDKFLPRATGFSTIIESLDKLAKANNVSKGPVSYTLTDVPGRADVNQVEIVTTVEGDYTHAVQFINQVERDPLFLLIDSINVMAGGGTPGQPRTIKLAVRLAAFFRS